MNQPLAGLRVIDFATLAAAPTAATYLAEFGADVIKVEQTGSGDPIRSWSAMKDGVSLIWRSAARNKRSVTIDLHTAEGRELLRRLIATADVAVTNFRPSTLQEWGLDYPSLERGNPGLVMLHVTTFGRGGPSSDAPGFGTMAEAMSGFAHMTGEPDGPPTLPSFPLADFVASLTATYAVLIALYHRDVNDGAGQYVDVNLLDPLARMLEFSNLQYHESGTILSRAGNRWDVSAPRNVYQTRDGRWIAISGSSPAMARRVFVAIGRDDMASDPAYVDSQSRLERAGEIDDAVASWVGRHDFAVCMERLKAAGAGAAPIYDAEQLANDPDVLARSMFIEVEDGPGQTFRVQAPVPRLSKTQGQIRHLGPALGEHTEEVLMGDLGLSPSQLRDLRDRKIV